MLGEKNKIRIIIIIIIIKSNKREEEQKKGADGDTTTADANYSGRKIVVGCPSCNSM